MVSGNLDGYKNHLFVNYSPETARSYLRAAADFQFYCRTNSINQITEQAYQQYIDDYAKRASPGSVKQRKWALSSYFKFIGLNLNSRLIKTPRMPAVEAKYLKEDDIGKYEELITRKVRSPQTKTVLLLLPHVGMRISEICSLKRENIEIVGEDVRFRFIGKRKKERVVPLNSKAREIFLAYLRKVKPQDLIFNIKPDTVRSRLRAVRDEISMPWLTPHKLRHTFAYSLVRNNVHIKVIADLLGDTVTEAQTYLHSDDVLKRSAVEKLVNSA